MSYTSTAGGLIRRDADGATIPQAEGNRDYAAYLAWREAGNTPAVETPPGPTADDVRAEAGRRMRVMVGARDAAHLDIIISNGNREAIRLLRIKADRPWTAAEANRAAELERFDAAIEAIRAGSNTLEALSPIPADFTHDRHWVA